MDPGPFTLRELLEMARARWGMTAGIMATIANANRDPKKPPAKPDQFNPFTPRRMASIGEFREMMKK
jgi:hypothetical protein